MNLNKEALELHQKYQGKIEVISKTKIKDMHDLAVVYTPGVAEPCRKIHQDTSFFVYAVYFFIFFIKKMDFF